MNRFLLLMLVAMVAASCSPNKTIKVKSVYSTDNTVEFIEVTDKQYKLLDEGDTVRYDRSLHKIAGWGESTLIIVAK